MGYWMKFLVFSDTHGDIETAKEVYGRHRDVTRILHLGDYERDGYRLEQELAVPVITVKGNMDGSYSTQDYKIHPTEGGSLYLTHGHMEGVKYGMEPLLYKASALGCKAIVFGHTHMPVYREMEGILLLNPGSLTHPRGGRNGSYAILEASQEGITASILYWDKNSKASKEPGGYLRRIFNESDRQ